MNIYRPLTLFLISLALLSAGCATTPVTAVNAWCDPQFPPTPTNSIALTDRPNPTPEDAELGRLLTAELQHAGFIIAPADKADYLLTYVTDHVTKTQPYFRTLPEGIEQHADIHTPQNNRQIVDEVYPAAITTTVHTFVFHSKEIMLFAYTNPKTQPGGLKMVWQGAITAGKSVTEEREQILIRTLLGYFGKAHSGEVNLTQ